MKSIVRAALACLFLACSVFAPGQAKAQESEWYYPQPPYPARARHHLEQGQGTMHVRTGADGLVAEAHMAPGTGSKRLDEAAVQFVRTYWRGPANQSHVTVLNYHLSR